MPVSERQNLRYLRKNCGRLHAVSRQPPPGSSGEEVRPKTGKPSASRKNSAYAARHQRSMASLPSRAISHPSMAEAAAKPREPALRPMLKFSAAPRSA